MTKPIEYDLIIIGAGGGANIAKEARKKGLKLAVIEKERIGGTCLNRGCTPSKMLIHPADIATQIQNAKKFDINAKINNISFKKLTQRITNTVLDESAGYNKKYKQAKDVDFYNTTAKFISDKIIKVGNKTITAKKIVIATGARPSIPPIPGLKDTPYWDSTDALRSPKLPKKLIVIGGGYIAVELGHAYSALGSNTHFLVMGNFIAREDKDVIKEFTNVFTKNHNTHQITNINSVSYKNKQFTIKYTTEDNKVKTIKGDNLLVATGVKPNTDTLGLENTKIKTNKFGYIQVNNCLETDVKGIYAMGDCIGNYLFRHAVNYEASEYLVPILIHNKKKQPINYPPMPHAIFTNPQIAGVGATEQELIEKKVPYVCGLHYYKNSAMGMALLSETEFVKLLFHKKTKKLLGAHIIGDEASIMIHILIAYMTMNATIDDILKMIYIHPALPEVVRNAARDAKAQLEK